MLATLNENITEKDAKKQRLLDDMLENEEEPEEKKKVEAKSLYQLASELQNENMNPSVESYGSSNVFQRYKKNKWFENINVIALKRMKEE